MEPLWSPVVATGGNQLQIGRSSKPQKQAKSVATGCRRLPREVMVTRGSTVRVRQRALQKPRKSALSLSGRLAGCRTWVRYGALYRAFRSKRGSQAARHRRSWGAFTGSHAAMASYSWISPPSSSRRRFAIADPAGTHTAEVILGGSGVCRSSALCGRRSL